MALARQMCVNHPDRPAMGVCVLTRKPICPECSTQYEGVNYSKEGLQQLQERRAAAARRQGNGRRLAWIGAALGLPLMLFLLFLFYEQSFMMLIHLQQNPLFSSGD